MRYLNLLCLAIVAGIAVAGCGPSVTQQPISQAPPVGGAPPGYGGQAIAGAQLPPPGSQGVYQWQDVPVNQRVPIARAVFDQGGYQLFAESGETIVVPFINQNLYVLKFGQTSGGSYFVNEGNVPVLYLSPGGFLENAAAQGARWYPFSQNYAYTQPVYIGLAPSWSDYVGMGWYPGMHYYGGLWGASPYVRPVWMPGFYVSIGGNYYHDYGRYRSYYTTHTNYVPMRSVYSNYGTRSTGSFGSGRSGSYSSGRSGFGTATGSTGSFGAGRSGTSGSFRSGSSSAGFGRSSGGSFGSGSTGSGFGRSSGGSFGSGSSSSGSGRSSFGGSQGYSNSPRSSGSSFGGGRSSGGSFGGGRSSGGSFGGRRR